MRSDLPTSPRDIDVEELLRRHRPPTDDPTAWDEAAQDAVLADILTRRPGRPDRPGQPATDPARSRGRWVGLGVAACAAAAVPLALSVGLPPHSPAGPTPAAALDRLATVAEATGPVLGPGQYLHRTDTTDVPYVAGIPLTPGAERRGDRVVSLEESWSGQNEVWIRALSGTTPCLEVVHLDGQVDQGGYDVAGAQQLATLPTDPTRLAAYLDQHPDGGNEGTANRFAAATDLLWSGIAHAGLRSAALDVLAQTPGLSGDEHTTDDRGRPAIRIDYATSGGTQSVWFDPATAQITERGGPTEGGSGSSTLDASDVVSTLPDLPLCSAIG